MLAISVELLTGRYVATAHDDRSKCEWPPHPARFFSAMVAAWAEQEPPDADERSVLVAFEHLDAPRVRASKATPRSSVTHFVPVNDASVIGLAFYKTRASALEEKLATLDAALDATGGDTAHKAVRRALAAVAKQREVSQETNKVGKTAPTSAVAMLPEGRERQPRVYPSMTPDDPLVVFSWPDLVLDSSAVQTLDGLLGRVTRLGHSSSLVSCRVSASPGASTWEPASDGSIALRWIDRGQLAALEAAHEHHRASRPRSLPSRSVRYRATAARAQPGPEAVRPALGGDWFTFEFDTRDRRLPMTRTLELTRALRGAVLKYSGTPSEHLSGHTNDGAPSCHPHVAFVALPFVGHPHASGRLLGAAVLLPSDDALGPDAGDVRAEVLRAIANWRSEAGNHLELRLGTHGVVRCRFTPESDLRSLERDSWARPGRQWVSVTPVALPHHPGALQRGSAARRRRAAERAEEQIRLACAHAGLPEPSRVAFTGQPLIAGVRPAHDFPAFQQFDRTQSRPTSRLQVHVSITFAEPVHGPLLLGSGRYFGLGLFLRQTDLP